MSSAPPVYRLPCFWPIAALIVLLAVLAVPLPVAAAEPVSPGDGGAEPQLTAGPPVLLAGGVLDWVSRWIGSALNSPRRMLQVCAVGACIAMYIMMRARNDVK